MENGQQNGLKCILRDIDFHFIRGRSNPRSHTLPPLVASANQFKTLAFSALHPPPPRTQPLWVQP